VCTLCGRVAQEKMIDLGSEWRNFGEGEDKSRAEGVDDLNDKLTTKIMEKKMEPWIPGIKRWVTFKIKFRETSKKL